MKPLHVRLREKVTNPRCVSQIRGREGQPQTLIDSRDLMELLDQYESMDANLRVIHTQKSPGYQHLHPERNLHEAIALFWHYTQKNGEHTMLIATEIISGMIRQKYNEHGDPAVKVRRY